jgi:hypothetical protein
MSCPCGYCDECDGEHGVLYPLQDGGMCTVIPCKEPTPLSSVEDDVEVE